MGEESGIRLEGRDGEVKHFHHFDPNIFAACYAYLNPYGVQGYRYGLRYRDTPASANPNAAPDPNTPFEEDEPDDTAQVSHYTHTRLETALG